MLGNHSSSHDHGISLLANTRMAGLTEQAYQPAAEAHHVLPPEVKWECTKLHDHLFHPQFPHFRWNATPFASLGESQGSSEGVVTLLLFPRAGKMSSNVVPRNSPSHQTQRELGQSRRWKQWGRQGTTFCASTT